MAQETKSHGKSERKFTSVERENYLVRISQASSDLPSGRNSMRVKNICIKAKDFIIILKAEMLDFINTVFNINPVNKTFSSLDSP